MKNKIIVMSLLVTSLLINTLEIKNDIRAYTSSLTVEKSISLGYETDGDDIETEWL